MSQEIEKRKQVPYLERNKLHMKYHGIFQHSLMNYGLKVYLRKKMLMNYYIKQSLKYV